MSTKLTTLLSVLCVAACGELEAEYVNHDATGGPDADADSQTDGSTDTAAPLPELASPTYVCKDEDKDGYCAFDAKGKAIDCNDSGIDADGIVDGKKFAPGLIDICDGLDNDCDGLTDEDAAVLKLYVDKDGDGYGAGELVDTCSPVGFAAKAGDCNDADPKIHPGAEDKPGDGIDVDCDDEMAQAASSSQAASLTISAAKETKLALTTQVFSKYEDLGDWWDQTVTESWAKSVKAKLEVPDNACGVRFNVTFGGGSYETWACVTENGVAKASELLQDTELDVMGHKFSLHDVELWMAPEGGCSLVVRWKTDGECAKLD